MTKRNFIMHRNLCGLTVQQRTKDGLFDASSLIQQWNEQNPNQRRLRLSDFFKLDSTKLFLDELIEIKKEEIQQKNNNRNSLEINWTEKSPTDNQTVTELEEIHEKKRFNPGRKNENTRQSSSYRIRRNPREKAFFARREKSPW